jgi:SAM-dependent methyltransferase
MDYQELASKVPRYYSNHPVYQSIWFGGEQIVKGTRDDMAKRMNLIRKDDIKDKTVVDIGCNLGAASLWAIENGAKNTIGYDVVPEGIEVANKIAKELDVDCVFEVNDFGKRQNKVGDVAFMFACHDDISKDGQRDKQLLENLKQYPVVYFETHLKETFDNWDMPELIKNNFNCEYLGETGEGGYFTRDFYRLT